MTQDALDFSVPVSGLTRAARHSSWTGARQAVKTWTAKQSALLQLLTQAGGPMNDHELAAVLRWPLSSVCSVRNSVRDLLAPDGFDAVTWPDGGVTRRTRWKINRINWRGVNGEGSDEAEG